MTVELPAELLDRARKSTGDGITATIRRGLELVASARAQRELDVAARQGEVLPRPEGVARRPEMIALDSSALIAYLSGADGDVADAAGEALEQQHACLPPVVLAELLSDPALQPSLAELLKALPRLEVTDGYWERGGTLRRNILKRGLRARLADSLIAQSCIDHRVPLVTADRDFRHFLTHGLKLLP